MSIVVSKGNVSFCPTKGWRARLVLPDGKRLMSYHHNPMIAGAILKSYREDAKRMAARMAEKAQEES